MWHVSWAVTACTANDTKALVGEKTVSQLAQLYHLNQEQTHEGTYTKKQELQGPLIGSMCTGYGGLDLAVEEVLGAKLAWYAEIDPAASKVLAAQFPGVPNLGDLRTVDWTAVQKVNIVTAGSWILSG